MSFVELGRRNTGSKELMDKEKTSSDSTYWSTVMEILTHGMSLNEEVENVNMESGGSS